MRTEHWGERWAAQWVRFDRAHGPGPEKLVDAPRPTLSEGKEASRPPVGQPACPSEPLVFASDRRGVGPLHRETPPGASPSDSAECIFGFVQRGKYDIYYGQVGGRPLPKDDGWMFRVGRCWLRQRDYGAADTHSRMGSDGTRMLEIYAQNGNGCYEPRETPMLGVSAQNGGV